MIEIGVIVVGTIATGEKDVTVNLKLLFRIIIKQLKIWSSQGIT